MYSTNNEGKFAVAEIYIRNLKEQYFQIYDFTTKKCEHWQISWYSW